MLNASTLKNNYVENIENFRHKQNNVSNDATLRKLKPNHPKKSF